MVRITITIDIEEGPPQSPDQNPTERAILKEFHQMADTIEAEVTRLQGDVSSLTTVNASAVALITGLAQQIRDNQTNPATLSALADSLEAQSTALANAVAANTPSDPAATAPPAAPAAPATDNTAAASATSDTTAAAPSDAAAPADQTAATPPVSDPTVTPPAAA